jgi:hypothetical protein
MKSKPEAISPPEHFNIPRIDIRPRPNKTPKPMLEALQELSCDGRLKAKSHRFLQDDLTKLRSEADFREAFHGLLVTQQLLGPLHSNYCRSLEAMRKVLESYAKHVDHWYEMSESFVDAWTRFSEVLKKHIPAEYWEHVHASLSRDLANWQQMRMKKK